MNSSSSHTSLKVTSERPHQEKHLNGGHQHNNSQNWNNTSTGAASSAQERIWLDMYVRQIPSSVYNIPVLCEITNQNISVKRLRTALLSVIQRHPPLHTSLNYNNEEKCLKQLVKYMSSVDDSNHDDYYSFQFTRVSTKKEFDQILEFETNGNHFNIETGIVLKCHIVKHNNKNDDILDTGDCIIFNFHHIAVDGRSIKPFFNDLQDAYMGMLEHTTDIVSYLHYAIKEKQTLNDHSLDLTINEARKYWHNMVRQLDTTKLIPLPYDYPEKLGKNRSGTGVNLLFQLNEILTENITKFAKDCNMSVFQLLLTCYSLFLHKMARENTLWIGGLQANRPTSKFQNIIGMFVNIVPYRSSLIDFGTNFKDLVEKMKKQCADTNQYSYLPFQEIIKLVRCNTSQNSQMQQFFFQTLFTYENTQYTSLEFLDTKCKNYNDDDILRHRNTAQFDLTLSMKNIISHVTNQPCLTGSFEYSCDLFQSETVATMIHRFRFLLEQLFLSVTSPSFDLETQPLYELSLLLPQETELLHDINETHADLGQICCIHHEFVSRAQEHPQKLAVILDNQSLTYSEMLYYVQCLASYLTTHLNVKQGDIICQCVERSIEMVIGALAIITSGAVYCPLNPNEPDDRLRLLINDVKANVVLVDSQTEYKFDASLPTALLLINIEEPLSTIEKKDLEPDIFRRATTTITPDNLCYLLFTSGSTGKPKAVQIRHRNFVSYIQSCVHLDMFNDKDILLQIAPCSFDVHVEEILGSMYVGATVIMLKPNGHLEINYLSHVIQHTQVTFIDIVPTLLRLLCEFLNANNQFNRIRTVRTFAVGGNREQMVSKTISMLMPHLPHHGKIKNTYGPAECTVACCDHLVTQKDLISTQNIPIGRPLPNYQCYLLDDCLQRVHIGQIGEIYIGGVGVFAGYYNRDDLTEETLIDIPGVHGKCYRTGDLGRFNENGALMYCGRIDYQVKLRGQRIELGEIENCIMKSSPLIVNCVVVKVHDDKTDQDYLAAYIQTMRKDIQENVRQYCQSHLPSYMVPTIVVLLEQLPLNENAKVDRKQLPKFEFSLQHPNDDDYVEPTTDDEREIHRLWCELLGVDKISTTKNFFSLGGNSLLLMRLMNYYQTSFAQQKLNISILFRQPTIQQHAQLVTINTDNNGDHEQQQVLPKHKQWQPLNINEAAASSAQERIWIDEQVRFDSNNPLAIYNIPIVLKVIEGTVSVSRLRNALLAMICKHSILRTKLIYSPEEKCLKQYIKPTPDEFLTPKHDDYYSFEMSVLNNEQEFDQTMLAEVNRHWFCLETGTVFRCHVVKNKLDNNDTLMKDDAIILNFHHSAFDGSSMTPFLNGLQ
ncbi:unnamed protein product, partial [Didymodactylos carnosus]